MLSLEIGFTTSSRLRYLGLVTLAVLFVGVLGAAPLSDVTGGLLAGHAVPRSSLATLAVLNIVFLILIWANTRLFPFTRQDVHDAIVRGRYFYPFQHRILVPLMAELLRRLGVPLRYGYLVLRVVPLWMGINATSHFLIAELGITYPYAVMACMFIIAYLPFVYYDYWLQNGDALNFWIFALAMAPILSGNWVVLGLIVMFGTLNRETTLLLVLAYAPFAILKGTADTVAPVFLAWLVPYGGLRWYFSDRPSDGFWVSPCQCLPYNLREPRAWLGTGLIFAPWLAVVVLNERSLRSYDPLILLAAALTIPWLIVHSLVAKLDEPRLFLPLMPVWVTLAVRSVAHS